MVSAAPGGDGRPGEQECDHTPVCGQLETWREAHRDCLLQRVVRPGRTRWEDWEEENKTNVNACLC